MLPSEPPTESIEEWIGCHVKVDADASFSLSGPLDSAERGSKPLSRHTSRIMRRSNSRAVWSRAHVASKCPLWRSKATFDIVFLCPCSVVRHRPVLGSQSLT